jgi:REP element-mobilizing transposase RayT
MARKPRIHYPGALYHVILRGNARQDIFHDDGDRYRFYLFIQQGIERYGHRIVAFCLMTNHVHLAIQVGEIPLSRVMQNLSFRYTRWLNWRLGRSGHLFQGRYKAVMVDADSYLQELTAYLHLNPVRAGMVETPADHRWSSHRAYLGSESIPWLNTEYVLATFSPDLLQARERFAGFVSERLGDGHRDEFHGTGKTDSRIIGEDYFVERVLAQDEGLPLRKPGLDEILAAVKAHYGLDEDELAAAGQRRTTTEARGMAAWLIHEVSNATLTELARRFNRDLTTMSAAAKHFETRRKCFASVGSGLSGRLS